MVPEIELENSKFLHILLLLSDISTAATTSSMLVVFRARTNISIEHYLTIHHSNLQVEVVEEVSEGVCAGAKGGYQAEA